jgi:hypothetical protein
VLQRTALPRPFGVEERQLPAPRIGADQGEPVGLVDHVHPEVLHREVGDPIAVGHPERNVVEGLRIHANEHNEPEAPYIPCGACPLSSRARRAAASIVAIGVTLSGVATILLAGVDLYMRGKLEAALARHHLVTTDSVDPPDVVVADVARMDPQEIADAYPDVPLLGFTNHSDTAGLRAAHEAGFDQVVAKSALSERAAELIEELLPSLE